LTFAVENECRASNDEDEASDNSVNGGVEVVNENQSPFHGQK